MNLDQKINRRNTNCVKWDTVDEDVLSFGIADMDFRIPDAIIDGLKEKVDQGVFGYSITDPELPDVIARHLEARYHIHVEKDWIIIFNGIVPIFTRVAQMSKGEVIVPVPNYNMLIKMIDNNAAMLETRMKIEDGSYKLDFDQMETLVGENTDIFCFCNPHNPLGKVYSREELKELSEFCAKHHLIIVSDEAHCDLCYEKKHTTMIDVDEYAKMNSITLFSPGKTFNIAGLPFSFALVPNPELREKFLSISFPGRPSDLACVAAKIAYSGACDNWLEEVVAYLKGNRDYLEETFASKFPKAKFLHMEGTYLMWVDFTAYFKEPAKELLEKARINVGDGANYHGDGYVRINFATQRSLLEEMVQRIEKAIQ